MNRFLLFGGNTYYPCGGGDDFIRTFSTLEEAKEHCIGRSLDWFHVWDTEVCRIVWRL